MRCSLLVGLAAVAFVGTVSGHNVAGSLRRLPPALCSQLLDQTYGAIQGWTPSEGQLRAMCKGLMVHKMKAVRTAAAAAGPCHAFASTIAAEAAAASQSRTHLPSLPLLKEKWCAQTFLPSASLPAPASSQQAASPNNNVHPEDADPDSWWPAPPPAQDAAQSPTSHTASLAAVGAEAHAHHHHRRHKAVKHEPLDPAAMLKLREDLLAGREESVSTATASADSSAGGPASPVAPAAALQAVQVKAAVSKSATQNPPKTASPEGKAAPGSDYRHPIALLQRVASHTASWLGSSFAGALDFVCDGRCGGHQRRTALIIN